MVNEIVETPLATLDCLGENTLAFWSRRAKPVSNQVFG
jgi:hypothetical protein